MNSNVIYQLMYFILGTLHGTRQLRRNVTLLIDAAYKVGVFETWGKERLSRAGTNYLFPKS